MTNRQFRRIIKEIGISQRKAAVAFGYTPRHGARWASLKDPTPVPHAVAICLTMMARTGIKDPADLPATLTKLMDKVGVKGSEEL
jgi:hypothetical protein